MHNLYIRVRKDPVQEWVKFLFIATNDAIFEVIALWSPEWRAPDLAQLEKIATQQKRRETKLCITKLVERKRQKQDAATQKRIAEAAVIEHMVRTIAVPTDETEEGQEMSMEQNIHGEEETPECTNLTTKLTQIKRLHI